MGKNVLVIAGPTATGKTALSIELAKELNGEIVSADSMQVYRYMDIGTAKPTKEEMQGIKHYMIDEVYPDEEFNVARYRKLADGYIDEILGKGKLPIVVGGTGLYIKSLTDGLNFTETVCDWNYRERLKNEAEEKGNACLYERLLKVDPEAAEKIHPNNVRRVIRALEVYEYTGVPISVHRKMSATGDSERNYIIYGLTMDRDLLHRRIDLRVDMMIEKGLTEEVRKLMSMGYGPGLVSMQGLGYKEMIWYLQGKLTFREAVEILKRNTRRYAKRQLTWFRADKRIRWVDMSEFSDSDAVMEKFKMVLH